MQALKRLAWRWVHSNLIVIRIAGCGATLSFQAACTILLSCTCFFASNSPADEKPLIEVSTSIELNFDGREVTDLDLGVVPAEIESIVDVKWFNKSSQSLTILSSRGTCACLVGHLDKQVIKPAEPIHLKLHARPAAHVRGLQQQLAVSMHEGDPSKIVVKHLQVTAKVLPLFRVEPKFADVKKGESETIELTVSPNFRTCSGKLAILPISGKLAIIGSTYVPNSNASIFQLKVKAESNPRESIEKLTLDIVTQSGDAGALKEVRCSTEFDLRFKNHVVFRPSRIPLSQINEKHVGIVLLLCESHWKKGDSFKLWRNSTEIGDGLVLDVESRKTILRLEIEESESLSQFTPVWFELPVVGRLSLDVRDEE